MGICYSFRTIKENKTFMTPMIDPIEWKHTTPFVPPIKEGYVIKVYDGDTITIAAKLPYDSSPLYRFQVRLKGIDSPEIKGKLEEEKKAAEISKAALESLILHKTVMLKNQGQEKYGRILADIYIDSPNGNIHVNQWLIDKEYAVRYNGKKKEEFNTIDKTLVNPCVRNPPYLYDNNLKLVSLEK
jgi:endonuclease YncB( thermonuclease family)